MLHSLSVRRSILDVERSVFIPTPSRPLMHAGVKPRRNALTKGRAGGNGERHAGGRAAAGEGAVTAGGQCSNNVWGESKRAPTAKITGGDAVPWIFWLASPSSSRHRGLRATRLRRSPGRCAAGGCRAQSPRRQSCSLRLYQRSSLDAAPTTPRPKIAQPRDPASQFENLLLPAVSQEFSKGVIDQGSLCRNSRDLPAFLHKNLIQNYIGSRHVCHLLTYT